MPRRRGLVVRARVSLKALAAPAIRSLWAKRSDLPFAEWGLALNPAQHLAFEGVDLHALTGRWGSPLHVVLEKKLEQNVAAFAVKSYPTLPGCEVFYSYKTNPVPGVLKKLHRLGVGAEVISAYELWLARRLGVSASRIIYNGPAKSRESLREAIRDEVGLINLNSREELPTVGELAEALGKRPRVGLRVSTRLGWAAQFGIPIGSGEALRAYGEALRDPRLQVVGLHAHVGTLIREASFLTRFVGEVLAFTDLLRDRLGLELSILDLGGSLAVPTVAPIGSLERRLNRSFLSDLLPPDPRATLPVRDYVKQVQEQVHVHYARRGRAAPRIFLEPGRALTGNAQLLLCRVLAIKEGAGALPYAVIDAGINLAEAARGEFHQLFPVNKASLRAERCYRLVGPICSPGDVVYAGWKLPPLEPEDSLALMDSGAYFVPFETAFSFPRTAVVLLGDGGERLLRRRETFEDLIARDALAEGPGQAEGQSA